MSVAAPSNISQLQRRIAYLEEVNESQKRSVNALQNEVQWLESAIFNPGFNELDIRLLVKQTPREIRMGFTSEAKERKIYLPAIAEEVHASPQTASVHLRKLAAVGAFSYRTETDKESGNPRVYIAPCPLSETPDKIELNRAKRGGSTWEDGKRVKRCKDCGSANLAKVSQIICMDCGSSQSEKIFTPVNDPHYQYDSEVDEEETNPHIDSEPEADDPHSQYDSEPAQHSKSSYITVDTVGVPSELRDLPQWVCWRYGMKLNKKGKLDKLPYDAKLVGPRYSCDYTNPLSWTSYEQAQARYEESQSWKLPYAGVGFVFNHNGIVGIDQDDSLEPRIDSYTELSVSEAGIHTFAHGSLKRNVKRSGIEMYDHGRFFTWTGKHLAGTPETIEDRQAELDALFAEIAPEERRQVTPCVYAPCQLPDQEVLDKARNAYNGAKFTALWEGSTKGYASQSEADLALCSLLAYWTGNDTTMMDRLFRQSGLYRDAKWDRAARVGETYGEGTIRRALYGDS